MSNISNFAKNFQGGVRPNQFEVTVQSSPVGAIDFKFLGKGAQIPASVIGNIDVPYLGRQLKVPGDRTFEDWTITVFNDPNWAGRSQVERWMQKLQGHRNPVRTTAAGNVYGQAIVRQKGRDGNNLATYVMEDIYPINLAAIDLDYGTNDTVEEYQITFAINNWYNTTAREPNASGSGVDIDFNVSLGGINIGSNGISANF